MCLALSYKGGSTTLSYQDIASYVGITKASAKANIVEILRNEKMEIDFNKFGWFVAPDRVSKQIWELVDTRLYSRVQSEILSIEHKG